MSKPSSTKNGANHRAAFKSKPMKLASAISGMNLGSEQGLARVRAMVQEAITKGMLKPSPPIPEPPRIHRKKRDFKASYTQDKPAYMREYRSSVKTGERVVIGHAERARKKVENY